MTSYKIVLFTTNGTKQIGSCDENKKITNLTPSLLPPVVIELNNEILTQISQVQGQFILPFNHYYSKIVGSDEDKMEFLFLETLRYRRCTVFVTVQYSYNTNQTRIMAYGTDQIVHSAESFYTTLENITSEKLYVQIQEIIKNINYNQIKINEAVINHLKNNKYIMFV